MSNQYIGARYVPEFMGNWNETLIYTPLSVVDYGNASYISIHKVPAGILPTNSLYWKLYISPSPQVEEIQEEINEITNWILPNKFRKGKWEGANVVFITDSWGITSYAQNPFPNQLATNLKFKEFHLDAYGGSGFIGKNSHTYASRIPQIATTTTPSNINYVIFYGSINDDQEYEDVLTAVTNTVNLARTTFVNAEIIIIPPIGGYDMSIPSNIKWAESFYNIYNSALALNIENYPLFFLMYGTTNMFNADNHHLNQDGADFVSYYLSNYMISNERLYKPLVKLKEENINVLTNGFDIYITCDETKTLTRKTLSVTSLGKIKVNSCSILCNNPNLDPQTTAINIYNSPPTFFIPNGIWYGSGKMLVDYNIS